MIEWGKAFQVAFVGLSGVFAGLILLDIFIVFFARIFRVVEWVGAKRPFIEHLFIGFRYARKNG
ncbi:MAG: hypothetical protein LLG97_21145 [Deltaproteobacteria bacterium]|nr:hypothetical protein [Deltaproteobacteria bacterium]